MRTSRLEAFSDGVLAIVITIMVLELAVPSGHEWSDLLALWPKVLSYLISFVYVGIYWNNHHHLFQLVERVNGAVLWANLNLLLWLSLFPFVTGWAGESHFAAVPMTCYAAVALMAAVSYTILQQVAVRAHESNARAARAAGADRKGLVSIGVYLIAIVAPFFGAAGGGVFGGGVTAVAVLWFVPDRRVERVLSSGD